MKGCYCPQPCVCSGQSRHLFDDGWGRLIAPDLLQMLRADAFERLLPILKCRFDSTEGVDGVPVIPQFCREEGSMCMGEVDRRQKFQCA